MISPGRYDEPTSTQVYLSTWPRKNWLRFVPFSRMISARSTNRGSLTQERAALAGDDVLRLVERQGRQVADAAERPAAVVGDEALGRVLDDHEVVPARRSSMIASISQPTPA